MEWSKFNWRVFLHLFFFFFLYYFVVVVEISKKEKKRGKKKRDGRATRSLITRNSGWMRFLCQKLPSFAKEGNESKKDEKRKKRRRRRIQNIVIITFLCLFFFFPLLFLLLFRHKNIVSALGIWPSAIHSGLWILSRKGKGQARRRCAATHAHTNKQDKKTRSNDRLLHTREWCSSAMTIFVIPPGIHCFVSFSLLYFLFDLFFFYFF